MFDLQDGVVTTTQTTGTPPTALANSITNSGNGWYRCSITVGNPSGLRVDVQHSLSNTPTANISGINYNGDGTSGAFLWGAQLEAGAFATSYIPTVASQVTRTADQASIVAPMFAPWFNASEGSFVAEVSYFSASSTSWVVTAHSGSAASTNDYISYVKNSAAINRQAIVAAGASQGNLDFGGAVAGTVYKLAGAYKLNDAAFTVNGATPLTDATVTLPTPNALAIGNLFSQFLNGHLRNVRFYPVRLSDLQLQALTA
jgi:hypothetical protein